MHLETLNLREVIVFLIAAGVIVPLFHRLRVSPVLGFLAVGLAIGPHGLTVFTDTLPWLRYIVIDDLEGVRALAELGVVFLLFMIGLELSMQRLWAMRRLVFGLGGAQMLVSGTVIAIIAILFGNTLAAAMIFGAAFALSSTAIVMQLLAENRRLGTATGRTSFAILLFQDLAVLPVLFLVGALGQESEGSALLAFLWAIVQALISVAVILVVGRVVLRPLFRFIGRKASREMFLALVLLVIIGTALATQQVGLSMALGAFLAGLLFAETEYRHEIEVDIEPFKGLLLGLFFISVGMAIDLTEIARNPIWLLASVVGLFLVKSPIIYVLARLFGAARSVALESGILLGQGGEFAFVIVGLAWSLGLIPDATAQFMLIVAGVTMIATPTVAWGAQRIGRVVQRWEAQHGQPEPDLPQDIAGHIIVVGFGRVGRMLGTFLNEEELELLAIDRDADLVAREHAAGTSLYYGDATRPDILKKFGAENAAALVVTMDSPNATERVVAVVRQHWPSLPIYARARDVDHAMRLIRRGATHAVPETTEASLQLSEIVLMGAGVPDQTARSVVEERRQAEQAMVDESRGQTPN